MDGQYLFSEEANYANAPRQLELTDDKNGDILGNDGLLRWDQSDDDDWGDFEGNNIERTLHSHSFTEENVHNVLSHGHSCVSANEDEEPLNCPESPYTLQASPLSDVNMELGNIAKSRENMEQAKVVDSLHMTMACKSLPDAGKSDASSSRRMSRPNAAYVVPHLPLKQSIDISTLVFQAGRSSYAIVLKKSTTRWYMYGTLLAARLLMLLVLCCVAFVTLYKMGRAVTCMDVQNCDDGNGVMAFPWLLHTDTLYNSAANDYTAITVHLAVFTIMMVLSIGVSIIFLVNLFRKGTSKYYKNNIYISTICSLLCGVASAGFFPPVVLTHSFCNIEKSVHTLGNEADKYTEFLAGSRNMCNMFGHTIGCFICALLCSITVLVLPISKLSKIWNTSFAIGYMKLVLGSFLLFLAIYFGTQSRAYNLQEYAFERKLVPNYEGVPIDVAGQYELYFATIQWAGYILALVNVCCGAFSYIGAWMHSHFFNVINIIVNFVFFFRECCCCICFIIQ